MWKAVLKWTLLGALAAYVVVMFIWARAEASRHVCTGIEVVIDGKGHVSSISEEGVKDVLKSYPDKIVGQPIHAVNTYAIADFLRGINSFETVDCLITTQGTLKVRVVPMVPSIRVFDASGKSYYVNKDGKQMAAIPGFHVDVPVVSGRFSDRFRPESLLPVVRYVQKDSMLSNVVGMIYADNIDNIILVPRIKGHVINLGDTTRLDEKRKAIRTAYRSILPHKGWETYDTISVKYRGQIVATRRDKTPLFPLTVIEEEDDAEEQALQAHAHGDNAASESKPDSTKTEKPQ